MLTTGFFVLNTVFVLKTDFYSENSWCLGNHCRKDHHRVHGGVGKVCVSRVRFSGAHSCFEHRACVDPSFVALNFV